MTLRPRAAVPRGVVTVCIVGLVSFLALGLGSVFGYTGLVIAGFVGLVIAGLAAPVTAGRRNDRRLVAGFAVGMSLLGLLAGLSLLGLGGLAAGLGAGLLGLVLLALLGLLVAVALGLVVIENRDDAREVTGQMWHPGPELPPMWSLAWMRRLLPPSEGATWWAEVISTLTETPDPAQRRAYVRGYHRELFPLLWTSWVVYLNSARQRKAS